MVKHAFFIAALTLATPALAQSDAPAIPTPANPFPADPVATDGSPLLGRSTLRDEGRAVFGLATGRSVATEYREPASR